MAQVYNPSTGLWEDDEENNSSLGGGFSPSLGSGPDLSSLYQQSTPSVPQQTSSPTSGGFDYNNLPTGYQWGENGYTRKYTDPYASTYDILNSGGTSIGTGYDNLQDALQKEAYKAGRKFYEPTGGEYNDFLRQNVGGTSGGWGHSAYNQPMPQGGLDRLAFSPEAYSGPKFGTEAELFADLLAAPGSPLSLESTEKYGRPIFDQQRQEALGQYLTGVGGPSVEDWTYHRDATGNQISDNITGLNTLYGSDVLIGPDGKIAGRRLGLNPEGMNLADTSGRVTSNTMLQRQYNPGMENYITPFGDGYGFVNEADTANLPGWQNVDDANYSKADSTFEGLLKKVAPMAMLAAGGMGLAGMFGEGAAGLGGAELLGEAGGYGFLSPEIAGAMPEFLGGGGLDFATGLDSLFSNPSFTGQDFIGGGNNFTALDSAFNGSEAFSPATQSLPSSMSSPLTDVSGVVEGVDPFATTEGVNKGFSKLTGYGLNDPYGKGISGLPTGTEQGIKNMYNTLSQPIGGQRPGLFQAPSPLSTIFRGLGALDSVNQNNKAMDMYKDQIARVQNQGDPNRARGNTANDLWTQNFQNPMAAFGEFMNGPGRAFTDQARAAAARSGRRGSYLNSGKMNSDLASLFLQNQNARGNALHQGFEAPVNNEAAVLQNMAPLAQMERNKYSPLWQVGGDFLSGGGLEKLFGMLG